MAGSSGAISPGSAPTPPKVPSDEAVCGQAGDVERHLLGAPCLLHPRLGVAHGGLAEPEQGRRGAPRVRDHDALHGAVVLQGVPVHGVPDGVRLDAGQVRVLDVHHQAHAGLGSAAGMEKFASVPCGGGGMTMISPGLFSNNLVASKTHAFFFSIGIWRIQVALFCMCMGGIMYFLEYEPDTMAPFLRGLIRRFLASKISNPSPLPPNRNASYSYLQTLNALEQSRTQPGLYCSSLSRRSHCRISNVWSFLHNFIMIIWKNVMKITEQLSKTASNCYISFHSICVVVLTKVDLITIYRSESFPLWVTGWSVELMAYAFLVVSPPDMSQCFEEMAAAASNKTSSWRWRMSSSGPAIVMPCWSSMPQMTVSSPISREKSQDLDPNMRDEVIYSSPNFDPKVFLSWVHKDTSAADLEAGALTLKTDPKGRTQQKKLLVKENFDCFVSCKTTIDVTLKISGVANRAFEPLFERQAQAEKIRSVQGMLQRFRTLFNLPSAIRGNIRKGEYDLAVREYQKAKSIVFPSHLLTRKLSIPAGVLSPYRLLILICMACNCCTARYGWRSGSNCWYDQDPSTLIIDD
ncbi:Exocyst complex component SEC5B [Zea mays]|uniref:Exocyst complex component SEC5 n=1 Tax=Zea mays TaxID=4577 RepID=A0A3L6FD97_MAIZE|nr:Exocyst complex component SEC5B [Zea mays]